MEPVPSLTPPRRPSAAATSTLRVAAALYTLFVAYGCLVPLDFTPVPWAEAMRRFHPIAAFHPEHFSRTDFTANTLLFMPLAFVWAGAAGAGWKRAGALAAAVVVWIGAVLFQTALEFSQIYTPPRNVSLWDVIAAGLGAAIGVAAWLVAGGRVRAALDRWGAVRGRAGVAGWLAAPYAVFLVLYNVLPLDLTLDPSALHAKWTRGLIRPIPFTGMGGDIVSAALGLGTEAMLWLPLALFLVLSGRASRFVAWCATVFGAMAIEGVQLLVQSRVSDTTDILCAAAGAGVGVWLGGRWRGTAEVAEAGAEAVGGASARTVWGALVFATAWSGVLLGGFCYPFNFEYEPRAVARGIESLLSIPFRTYWLATEARAVTDLLRQVILFAPLGAAVAVAGAAWRGSGRGVWSMRTGAILAALGGALVGAMIEALQVFLPGKVPDSTDIVMAGIGGVAGFFGTRALGRALFPAEREAAGHADAPHAPHPDTPHADTPHPDTPHADGRLGHRGRVVRRLAASYGALLAVGALAKWAPGVPYNVRELFGKGGAWAVAGFPIAVGVCFAPPVVMARWMARGEWLRTAALPGVIALHALLLWIVMSAGVPVEAIQDVVGAPVLRWPGDAETMARFVALASGLSALFVGGALFVGALSGPSPPRDRRALGRWAAPALVVLLVARFVVVDRAATDNLIELMAGGGSVASSLWLAVWILTLAVGGTALASMLRGRIGRRDGLVLVLAGLVVGWMALSLGTERAIEKYGRTFSAMQFLLSPDREHYAGTGALVARYAAAHAGIVLLAALAQLPFVGHRRPRNGERR